jgi:hypothetical protein
VRRTLLLVFFGFLPQALAAQSSQFGVRGLGYPSRELGVQASASGGAFGLFDPGSSVNPAAIGATPALTSIFTVTQDYRRPENAAGTANVRDTRFPLLLVAGPVRESGVAAGVSYSNYTDRDFTTVNGSTVDLRGVPVSVVDTFSSRGGVSDLRFAGAYRVHNRWLFGGAFHVLTGSTRLASTRIFGDSSFLSARQKAEVSYAGVGVSVGVVRQFGPSFAIAALARSDGHLNVDRDSFQVGTVDLPYSFGLGLRWRPVLGLDLATQAIVRTWSGANSDLLEQGGTGSDNTIDVAAGAEYTPDVRRPFNWPLRLGAHYLTLPFPLIPGEQGHEYGVSLGSGLRFAQQRAGLDTSLQYLWRSEGSYSERAFILSLGISVRP